jgi:hypothetical protein
MRFVPIKTAEQQAVLMLHRYNGRRCWRLQGSAALFGRHRGLRHGASTVAGPVSAECQPVLDSREAPDQSFACRAAVGVGFRLKDEVLLSEASVGLGA